MAGRQSRPLPARLPPVSLPFFDAVIIGAGAAGLFCAA